MNVLAPTISEDDGDVRDAYLASFGEEGEAAVRYWATADYLVIQSIQSSETVRGRAMLQWLRDTYQRPLAAVEVTWTALGFWERMEKEGLVVHTEMADGSGSDLEQASIPFAPVVSPKSRSPRPR